MSEIYDALQRAEAERRAATAASEEPRTVTVAVEPTWGPWRAALFGALVGAVVGALAVAVTPALRARAARRVLDDRGVPVAVAAAPAPIPVEAAPIDPAATHAAAPEPIAVAPAADAPGTDEPRADDAAAPPAAVDPPPPVALAAAVDDAAHPEPPPSFAVQVGAFRERTGAERLVARLAASHHVATIGPSRSADAPWAVRVGGFATRAEATVAGHRLENEGFPGFVVAPGG